MKHNTVFAVLITISTMLVILWVIVYNQENAEEMSYLFFMTTVFCAVSLGCLLGYVLRGITK